MSKLIFSPKQVEKVIKQVKPKAQCEPIIAEDLPEIRKLIEGNFENIIVKHIEGTTLIHL